MSEPSWQAETRIKSTPREGKKYNAETLAASGTDAVISVIILKAGVEILMDSLSGIIGARVDSELSQKLKTQIGGPQGAGRL